MKIKQNLMVGTIFLSGFFLNQMRLKIGFYGTSSKQLIFYVFFSQI